MYVIRKLIKDTSGGTENGQVSRTREASIDGVPAQLRCPICYDVPSAEIYQCVHGHTICATCQASVRNCPQCRLPFEVNGQRIRVRELESFLDMLALPCPHQTEGCLEIVGRGDIKTHVRDCIYNGKCVQLCKQLGIPCGFWTNGLNTNLAVGHFKSGHNAEGPILLESSGSVEIHTQNVTTIGELLQGDGVWRPVILRQRLDHFMLLTLYNKSDSSVSWLCLELRCNETPPTSREHEVEFLIKNKTDGMSALTWKTPTLPLLRSKETIKCPGIRMPISLLKEHYMEDGEILKVKVTVTSATARRATRRHQRPSKIVRISSVNLRNCQSTPATK